MKPDAKEILDTMLGYLGFAVEIKETETDGTLTLQVYTPEKEKLIGEEGEVIDDLQFLLNRILQVRDPSSPKVQVDVEHFREMRNDRLVARVRKVAELVRETGNPFHLDPMNAYDRRVVHNAFKNDPEVTTWSPSDDARVKRITLKRRTTPTG